LAADEQAAGMFDLTPIVEAKGIALAVALAGAVRVWR
jgi:hypothetical protein